MTNRLIYGKEIKLKSHKLVFQCDNDFDFTAPGIIMHSRNGGNLSIGNGITALQIGAVGDFTTQGDFRAVSAAGGRGNLVLAGDKIEFINDNGTIVNGGTLTLPTSTDTLVGRATTDTLTNKTFTSPVFTSPSFSTITNTGILTLPTSTDTLVGRNTTDTLTNKTLTNPTISGVINLPTTTSSAGIINTNAARTFHTYGTQNTFTGKNSGNFTLAGTQNTGNGENSLTVLNGGGTNTANGYGALAALISGNANSGFGKGVFSGLTGGSNNIGLGNDAGAALTGTDSNNIMIGNLGFVGASQTIMIGNAQGKCLIKGIRGVTSDLADAIGTLVSSTGQLCTISSDRRLKRDLEYDLETEAYNIVKKLKPCKFSYKSDENAKKVWGLIADEAKEVIPEYVVKLYPEGKTQKVIVSSKFFNIETEEEEEEEVIEEEVKAEDADDETIQYHLLLPVMLRELQRIQAQVDLIKVHLNM